MGLLSGKFLRDVATGAGEAYLEKRQQARDNIVTYQERALNKYNDLQGKYDEGYKAAMTKILDIVDPHRHKLKDKKKVLDLLDFKEHLNKLKENK